MATGRTSGSSKSSVVEDASIGTAEATPADCDKGWMGHHLWGYIGYKNDDMFCFNCGRKR
jgi:hypothetical protein